LINEFIGSGWVGSSGLGLILIFLLSCGLCCWVCQWSSQKQAISKCSCYVAIERWLM